MSFLCWLGPHTAIFPACLLTTLDGSQGSAENGWAGLAGSEPRQQRSDQQLPSPEQSLPMRPLGQLGPAWRLEPKRKTCTFVGKSVRMSYYAPS
jgi:hypothetical protein